MQSASVAVLEEDVDDRQLMMEAMQVQSTSCIQLLWWDGCYMAASLLLCGVTLLLLRASLLLYVVLLLLLRASLLLHGVLYSCARVLYSCV